MQWIKCSENLPPMEEPVWLWVNKEPEVGYRLYEYDHEKDCDDFMWIVGEWYPNKEEVTHWAEITPPEGE